jgi:hypothetical protein
MPADARKITLQDLIPDAEYAKVRKERRAALLPLKRLRRLSLGPFCTVLFESYESMLFQVQEMLLTERGGAAQAPDELDAYNPLIPQGRELVATVMFEIDDPVRREQALARLGGVEDRFFLQVGSDRIAGAPEGDIERTRDDGKTAAVHFLHFRLTPEQIAVFRDPAVSILAGCDHEGYSHLAGLSPASRAELARDFA